MALLLTERFYLHGLAVSAGAYRAAAAKDKALPRFRPSKPAKSGEKRVSPFTAFHRVLVDSLLEKRNQREARKWLAKKTGDPTARSLGRFKRENDAAKFVEALYQAGAGQSDRASPLPQQGPRPVRGLPVGAASKNAARRRRKSVRQVCGQLRTRRLGAMQPDKDIGESHLFLSLA